MCCRAGRQYLPGDQDDRQQGQFMFVIDPSAEPVDYITIDTRAYSSRSRRWARLRRRFEILGAANTVLVATATTRRCRATRSPWGATSFMCSRSSTIDARPARSPAQPPRRGHRHLHPRQVLPGQGAAPHGRAAGRAARRWRAARPPRQRVDEVSRIAVTSPPPRGAGVATTTGTAAAAAEPAPPATAGGRSPPAAEPAPPPFTAPVAEPAGRRSSAPTQRLEWAFERRRHSPDARRPRTPAARCEGAGSPEPVSAAIGRRRRLVVVGVGAQIQKQPAPPARSRRAGCRVWWVRPSRRG